MSILKMTERFGLVREFLMAQETPKRSRLRVSAKADLRRSDRRAP
jgi:hypothetical protein